MSDLRLGLKSLLRSPGFTLIAVITLGVGIGAFTSAFSILNEVLFRPLPYPESGGQILTFLAVLGLGLASLDMYGVIARTMAQRTGEFGIRIALGALTGDIIRLVLASGAKLALAGSAVGLLGAFGLARLIVALFPSLQTNGVAVLTGVTVLLMAIALVACYMPARYASRINPIETLRAE